MAYKIEWKVNTKFNNAYNERGVGQEKNKNNSIYSFIHSVIYWIPTG